MSWLKGLGLLTGFTPQTLDFEDGSQVVTTALLAEGGYSFVYSARSLSVIPRSFAVKRMLTQDAEARKIAETEIALLKKLNGQPGFVGCSATLSKALGAGQHEHWMLLEYCPNGSLVDLLYKKGKAAGEYEKREPLSKLRVLEVFEMVAAAVAHLHSMAPPVAHRDLKLENVLGTADGRYVLCDFGSASSRVLPATRSRRAAVAEEEIISKYSTLMYRAPEMCDLYLGHEIGLKVDVWALGCILYALCFRSHPFAADSTLQILNGGYTIPADSPYASSGLHDLVRLLLQAHPDRRASSDLTLQHTRAFLRGYNPLVAAPSPSARAAPPPRAAPAAPTRTPTRPAGYHRGTGSEAAGEAASEAAGMADVAANAAAGAGAGNAARPPAAAGVARPSPIRGSDARGGGGGVVATTAAEEPPPPPPAAPWDTFGPAASRETPPVEAPSRGARRVLPPVGADFDVLAHEQMVAQRVARAERLRALEQRCGVRRRGVDRGGKGEGKGALLGRAAQS